MACSTAEIVARVADRADGGKKEGVVAAAVVVLGPLARDDA